MTKAKVSEDTIYTTVVFGVFSAQVAPRRDGLCGWRYNKTRNDKPKTYSTESAPT